MEVPHTHLRLLSKAMEAVSARGAMMLTPLSTPADPWPCIARRCLGTKKVTDHGPID